MSFLDVRSKSLFSLPRLTEVRWLGTVRRSLFTSDPDCIEAAMPDPRVAGLNTYVVINRLTPTVIESRRIALDRIFCPGRGQCSADTDVSRRILLPLDWDPVRETGTAATDRQRGYSAAQADATISYLCKSVFPEPTALVDSGNGRHGYFRFDAPNTPETDRLLFAFYSNLARKFDTADVKLDTSVRSAAQLMRLPGSFNHKAQRTCEILAFSERSTPVSIDLIRTVTDSLRGQLGQIGQKSVVRKGCWTPTLVEAFCDFYEIDYLPPAEIPQGTLYVLNPCPLNSEHVGSSPAILLTRSGFPKFCCKHASCQMSWKKFRGLIFRLTKKMFLTSKGVTNVEQ